MAAPECDAVDHPVDPVAVARGIRIESAPVVAHLEHQRLLRRLHTHVDARRVRVPLDVRQRLLQAAQQHDQTPAVPDRQAFYRGWARLWAQQMSPEAATYLSATSIEAPGQWRSNGTLANREMFAASFQCKAPGAMALPEASRVTVW